MLQHTAMRVAGACILLSLPLFAAPQPPPPPLALPPATDVAILLSGGFRGFLSAGLHRRFADSVLAPLRHELPPERIATFLW